MSGCDCWGLVRLVYRHELGIDLPGYDGTYLGAAERAEVARLIDRAEATGTWSPVLPSDIAPFDLLVFREGCYRAHVGVAIDQRHMLHMAGREQACIDRFGAPRFNSRLTGIYRHLKTASKGVS